MTQPILLGLFVGDVAPEHPGEPPAGQHQGTAGGDLLLAPLGRRALVLRVPIGGEVHDPAGAVPDRRADTDNSEGAAALLRHGSSFSFCCPNSLAICTGDPRTEAASPVTQLLYLPFSAFMTPLVQCHLCSPISMRALGPYSLNCREEFFSETGLPTLGLLGNSAHKKRPGLHSPDPSWHV